MTKHWVANLPEVGRPFIQKGEEIDALRERSRQLLEEAKSLDLQANRKSDELYKRAQEFWSLKEINEAMR